MSKRKECTMDLMLGIIVGGIFGALTALLLARKFSPKLNNDLLESLSHRYDEIMSKTADLIDNITHKSQELAQGMSAQTEEWAEKALELTNNAMQELSLWESAINEAVKNTTMHAERINEPEHKAKILGTLEWAQKALSVAENATKEINSWAEVIRETAEEARLQTEKGRRQADFNNNEETAKHAALEVIDWVALGLNLWQNVRNRK